MAEYTVKILGTRFIKFRLPRPIFLLVRVQVSCSFSHSFPNDRIEHGDHVGLEKIVKVVEEEEDEDDDGEEKTQTHGFVFNFFILK